MRLIQWFLLGRNLLLVDAATARSLRQAEVQLRKRHPIQVLVLLGVLLIILDHGYVGSLGANIDQVHLAAQMAMNARINLYLLTAIYRNLVTSIFLLLGLH